jgi:dienelactone hydrolase
MRRYTTAIASFALLASSLSFAQPPGITMEQVNRQLPLEGAPKAEVGKYEVQSGGAFASPRHIVFHPKDLSAFPAQDKLPVVLWGNGGCAIDNPKYAEFLSTIASHGFLVLTTTKIEGEAQRQQNADDLLAAIAWAETENVRAASALKGKIDLEHVAVMGQSCGGFLSVALGGDPRVDTIGVFNSGVAAPNPNGAAGPFATTDALAKLHGPLMFINGHEVDFMMEQSHNNYLQVKQPAFYGARKNAGHTATMYHPGGGEFANVAWHWLRYQFKGDAEAGRMFVGPDCTLCKNDNWVTESKDLK